MATVYPSDEYLAAYAERDVRCSTNVLERDYEDNYPEDDSDEDYYPGYGDYVTLENDCN